MKIILSLALLVTSFTADAAFRSSFRSSRSSFRSSSFRRSYSRPSIFRYNPAPRVSRSISTNPTNAGLSTGTVRRSYSSSPSIFSPSVLVPMWIATSMMSSSRRPIPSECRCEAGIPVKCPKEVECRKK